VHSGRYYWGTDQAVLIVFLCCSITCLNVIRITVMRLCKLGHLDTLDALFQVFLRYLWSVSIVSVDLLTAVNFRIGLYVTC